MDICVQSGNITKFAPKSDQSFAPFANIKKLSISLESLLFVTFSTQKYCVCKI